MSTAPRGFTLVELLATLTVLAVAMALAVPGMLGLQRSAQLSAAVNTLTAAIQAARGEAMKRNMHVFLVPAAEQSWASGYLVFVDRDRTGTPTSDDIVLARRADLPDNLELVGTGTAAGGAPYIRFDGSGQLRDKANSFPRLALTIRRRDAIGQADEYRQTRHVLIAPTGRVRSCRPASASDGDCSAL